MRAPWCHLVFGCWITFVQCHPAIAQDAQVALSLRALAEVYATLTGMPAKRCVGGVAALLFLQDIRDRLTLVALDEGNHNNLQGYAFRMALIHHPEFAGLVNDIVVEAGNSLYQDVMDKFVAGEDVPYDALRRVWQDTTQPIGPQCTQALISRAAPTASLQS